MTIDVSYLAISDKRCTVQFAGCNFRCRGCFSKERQKGGKTMRGKELAAYIPPDKEVMLAGGEPTINREGLLELIDELEQDRVILSTNGYLLDAELIDQIRNVTVHIDLKALNPELHRWYTGMDNRNVLEAIRLLYEKGLDFEVSTVYIPGIVDAPEIEAIARFLASVGDIALKIMRYVPVGDLSRRPLDSEIEEAMKRGAKYLDNVSSSIENRSHPSGERIIIVP